MVMLSRFTQHSFVQEIIESGMRDRQHSTAPKVMHTCVSQTKIERNFWSSVTRNLK